MDEAYAAFQRGDIDAARQLYMRVAQSDPTNRDAQLGLAAVDLRTQSLSSAESRYIKLLEIDPRDSHALAGLAAIRGAGDPVQAESRIKTLLTQQPDSAMLHFVLGNQYASQARWNEAQQAYFRAFSGDPENADFAFNLAVSLDQIRQERFALEYYERALRLSNGRQVAFDRTRTATRVKELQR
ncbi:MAG: tetratricopeptide repeat protein [Burkholderiales bacterium]